MLAHPKTAPVNELEYEASTVTPEKFRAVLEQHGVILLRNAVRQEVLQPVANAAFQMIDHFNAIPRDVIEREIAFDSDSVRTEWRQKLGHGLHYNMDLINFTQGRHSLFDPLRKSGLLDMAAEAWPETLAQENYVSPLHRIYPEGRTEGYAGASLHMHVDAAFHQFNLLCLNFWTPLTKAGGDRPGLQVLPMGIADSKAYMEFKSEGHADAGQQQANFSRFRVHKAELEALEEAGLLHALWRPTLEPGDVLVFTNFTIHGTWSEPGMSDQRTSIEARVLLHPRA